jgi:peptidoglycan/LPS O-acetylase OafA/YrhL
MTALTSITDETGRHRHLDGLRGVAALCVVVYHFIYFFVPDLVAAAPQQGWALWIASSPLAGLYNGRFCVWVFFVLSGFVLSVAMAETRLSLLALVVRRYLRLTLPILAAGLLILVALGFGVVGDGGYLMLTAMDIQSGKLSLLAGLGHVFADSLYGAYLTGTSDFNGVLWSMKVELFGSALVFLVWKLLSRRSWRVAVNVLLAIGLCFLGRESTLQGLQLFPVGMLLFELTMARRELTRALIWPTWLGAVILLIGLSLGGWLVKQPILPGASLIFTGLLDHVIDVKRYQAQQIGAVLVVAAIVLTPASQRILRSCLCQWLGAISFPLYLIHILIIATIGFHLAAWLTPIYGAALAIWVAGIGSIAACLVLATLITPPVEQGSVRLSREIGKAVDRLLPWRARTAIDAA